MIPDRSDRHSNDPQEFQLLPPEIEDQEPQNGKKPQNESFSRELAQYNYQRDENLILDQYNSYFSSVRAQLQQFNLRALDPNLLAQHGLKIISEDSDRAWKKLLNHGIAYVDLISSSYNGLECVYNVVISKFFMTVKVLNLHRNSQMEIGGDEFLGEGSYAKVKRLKAGGKEIALKKIMFSKKKTINLNINNILSEEDYADSMEIKKAISEYCFYKICSMLRIGPQVIFQNGYDLVCYNNCIEFQMELCQQVEKKIDLNVYERDLKKCLGILHSLKLIHKDIKKSNTLYSPSFKAYVLSDFGLSHSVRQQIWQKSQTFFAGSLAHASQDMVKLLYSKQVGWVNLYMNDVHGLKVAIEQVREEQKMYEEEYQKNSMSMGRHVFQSEDQAQSCDYISDEVDGGENRNEDRYMQSRQVVQNGNRLLQPIKNSSNADPSITDDRINYFSLQILSRLLCEYSPNSHTREQQYKWLQKQIKHLIKSQSDAQLLYQEIKATIIEVLAFNIYSEELELAHIRNTIRIFGLGSAQVFRALSEVYKKRVITNINYSKVQNYLAGTANNTNTNINVAKTNKISAQKLKNYIINMDRHSHLRNRRSVASCLRTLIQQYLASKQPMDQEKKQILLFGLQALGYEELTEAENLQLISLITLVLDGKAISAQTVDPKYCLRLVDQIYKELAPSEYDPSLTLALLNSLIKINLKHDSLAIADFYRQKVITSKLQLLATLSNSSNLGQQKRGELKLEIIRHGLSQSVYFGLLKKHEQALVLAQNYYKKFTEYQLTDLTVKINVLDEIVNCLTKLKKFQSVDKYLDELGDLITESCHPKKNCLQFAFYYSYRGFLFFSRKEIEEAVKNFQKVLECTNDSLRGPNHVKLMKQTLKNLSVCYGKLDKGQKSIECLQKQLELCLEYHQFGAQDEAISIIQHIIVRLLKMDSRNSRILDYLEQLANYKYQYMKSINASLQVKKQTELIPLDFLESQNYNDEIILFIKRQLVSAIEPYVPLFQQSFLKISEQLIIYFIDQGAYKKACFYYEKIFNAIPRPYLFGLVPRKISTYVDILIDRRYTLSAYKFLRSIIYVIPENAPERLRQVSFRKLLLLSKDLHKTVPHQFYTYICRNYAFENLDNLNMAVNNLKYSDSVAENIKKIWEKKLRKLRNSMGRPGLNQPEEMEIGENPENSEQQESYQSPVDRKLMQKLKAMMRVVKPKPAVKQEQEKAQEKPSSQTKQQNMLP